MNTNRPKVLIESMCTLRTLVVLTGHAFTLADGIRIRCAGLGGILVGLGGLRIRHVVEDGAEEAVHAHAEEDCVGVLVAEGGDHVGDVRVPADDAGLPEFGDCRALGCGSGASVDRWDVQDDEVAGAALVELRVFR